ncbi:inaD-like protein isoform X2 [Gouania willdenowi]|uniref:inaD-like protein isoform X2 n=1 Tax=Gouania willdenowi TaxID=441366 RepID=UPI0010569035|nr:inaD-like protein isoform X2 [Gouania willdenowi]
MLDNMQTVCPEEQQQVVEALERLQSKLVRREEWSSCSTLRMLRDVLQSPLMGTILHLTHAVRQLSSPPPSSRKSQLIHISTNGSPPLAQQVLPPQDWMQAAEVGGASDTEHVQLTRRHGDGFGFSVVSLSRGVFINHIEKGGVAYSDGRLQVNDQILLVDGHHVMRGVAQQEGLSLLQQAGDTVELLVTRPRPLHVSADGWSHVEQIQLTNDGSGLGFGIVGGGANGIVVRTVIPGSPAHRDGRLRTGDHILSIGATPTSGLTSDQVIKVLQRCGSHVTMMIGREPRGQLTGAPPPPSSAPISAPTVERHVSKTPNLEGYEIHEVSLNRLQGQSLGISIIGHNALTSEDAVGVYVKHVVPGSSADQSGNIRVHDRLIALDGVSLHGLTNQEVLEVMKKTGQTVMLTVVRKKQPVERSLDRVESWRSQEVKGQPSVTESNDPITEQLREEVSRLKWQQALGSQYEVLVVNLDLVIKDDAELQRSSKLLPVHTLRLGVELDSFDGHHYVSSVVPGGSADRHGALRAEDEVLEVNGVQLYGKSRREVVSFLKQVPPPFTLTCCRHLSSEPEPVSEEPSADRLEEIEHHLSRVLSEHSSQVSDLKQTHREEEEEEDGEPALWSADVHLVELQKDTHGGLGFSILDYQDPVDPARCVMVIRSLVLGGPAQVHGGLLPGDQLVSVNETQLKHLDLNQAVEVLKSVPPGTVELGVRKPLVAAGCPEGEELILGTEMTVDEDEERKAPPSWEEWKNSCSLLVDDDGNSPAARRRRSLEAATVPRVRGHREAGEGEEMPYFSHWSAPRRVEVWVEEGASLGLSIVGGSHVIRRLRNGEELRGIFIKHVLPGSPAALTGTLKTGDKILEVGGVDLRAATHEEAVTAIKSAASPVSFTVQSLSAAPRPLSLTASTYNKHKARRMENMAFAPPTRRHPPPYRFPSQSGVPSDLRFAKGLV